MELKEMCTLVAPYKCPNCNNDLLFFTKNHSNNIIDYKNLMDRGLTRNQLIDHLGNKDIRCFKCIACQKMYIIDWSKGYPEPLTDKKVLTQFGYKFKE